jgi:hypothetical protein
VLCLSSGSQRLNAFKGLYLAAGCFFHVILAQLCLSFLCWVGKRWCCCWQAPQLWQGIAEHLSKSSPEVLVLVHPIGMNTSSHSHRALKVISLELLEHPNTPKQQPSHAQEVLSTEPGVQPRDPALVLLEQTTVFRCAGGS